MCGLGCRELQAQGLQGFLVRLELGDPFPQVSLLSFELVLLYLENGALRVESELRERERLLSQPSGAWGRLLLRLLARVAAVGGVSY